MTTRELNLVRKKMKCLGCSKMIVTDKCHRFCRVCERRNNRKRWHLPRVGKVASRDKLETYDL